jgi:hypothetical protein
MEPEGSVPYSQVPATCPYPEPTPSSPHDPLQLLQHPWYDNVQWIKMEQHTPLL